jgi:cellulose synthase operon protein C
LNWYRRFYKFLLAGKRVRVKPVIILVALAAILGTSAHFLHAFQVQRNASWLYDEALKMNKEGQRAQALDYLEQYLGLVPLDNDALANHGLWLGKDTKNYRVVRRAFEELSTVLRRKPKLKDVRLEDVRLEAARLAIQIGQTSDARELLGPLLAENPDDAELILLSGRCQVAAKDLVGAEDWFKKGTKLDPTDIKRVQAIDEKAHFNVQLYLDYAALLRDQLASPAVADDVISRLSPKAVEWREKWRELKLDDVEAPASRVVAAARAGAARYYLRTGDLVRAECVLVLPIFDASTAALVGCPFGQGALLASSALYPQRSNVLAANTEEIHLLAADVAFAQGNSAVARAYLERGRQIFPTNANFDRKLARVDLKDGKRQEALARLEPSLQNLPDGPWELLALGEILIDADGVSQANKIIERISNKGATVLADYLKARILMQKQQWGEARNILERVTGILQPVGSLTCQANLLLADCYRHLDSRDQELRACQRAVACEPNSRLAHARLTDALAANGKWDLARIEQEKVGLSTTQQPLARANFLVAYNLRRPEHERNWQEVEKLLEKEDQKKFEVKALRANILVATKQLDAARTMLEAERDRDPSQLGPWLFLLDLADLQQRRSEIPLLITSAEKAVGKRIDWPLARVRYWLREGGDAAVKELRELGNAPGDWSPKEAEQLRGAAATALAALGQMDDAERLWRELARMQPNNLRVRERLLEYAYLRGHGEALKQLLAEIRYLEAGSGAATAFGEGALALLRAKENPANKKEAMAEARNKLAIAGTLRPSWSLVPLLEAELFELQDQKEKAVERYKAALERGESRMFVVRRALALMTAPGRGALGAQEAMALLDKLPAKALSVGRLERFAAGLHLANAHEDPVDAATARRQGWKMARKAVPDDSKDYQDFLWLGLAAAFADEPVEAEKAFRRACELNEKAPETWATLILFLARKEPKRAELELDNAKAKLPSEKAPLALAPCNEALGMLEQAEKNYQATVASNPEPNGLRRLAAFYVRIGQSGKAQAALRQLLNPNLKAPANATVWARRTLALSLSAQGNMGAFKEAQQLLDENERESGQTRDDKVADQFARALVLAAQPTQRREAIRWLETLTAQQSTVMPEVQYFLAQLYEADGNWPLAKSQFAALVAAHEKNPVLLGRYARGLLRNRELKDANTIVERLKGVAPGVWDTVELEARVLNALDRKDKAQELILAYAKQSEARLDLAGSLLDDLGLAAAEAEQLFRTFVAKSKNPVTSLILAQHLARHQRTVEALDLCQKAWSNCSHDTVAQFCVIIVRIGKSTSEQQAQVERWIRQASDDHPTNLNLRGSLAELQDFRGKTSEAAGIYRAILKADPKNVVCLNNLAYLQALQKVNLDECLSLIDRAIEIAGPHGALLDSRAMVRMQKSEYPLAINDLQQAITARGSAANYYHLAQAQSLAGNKSAAQDAMNKARELGIQVQQLHPLEHAAFNDLDKKLQ